MDLKNVKQNNFIRSLCVFVLVAVLPILSELILCRAFAVGFSALRAVLYLLLSVFIFSALPISPLFKIKLSEKNHIKNALIAFTLIVTIILSVVPMTLNPIWNGEIPGHRAEYEEAADAYLEGRLNIETEEIPQALKDLQNPYDYGARKKIGIGIEPTLWDRAYYKGHLYLYFGVFPVLSVFMPYKAITGKSLTTWKATAIFTALSIAGLFALFYFLAKEHFKDMRLSVYLFLSTALCLCSFWYISMFPALYCTAISAGLMLSIWSVYLFCRAFSEQKRKKNLFIFFGAFLGALTFSARPTVALSSLIFLPFFVGLLFRDLKSLPIDKRKKAATVQLSLIIIPYVFVAVSIMLYNFVRFENPFEFGQSYQLTVADQHAYLTGGGINSENIVKGFFTLIFDFGKSFASDFDRRFPYISRAPVLFRFPVLLIGIFALPFLFFKEYKGSRLKCVYIPSIVSPFVIFLSDCIASPVPLMRYSADFTFLFAISAFVGSLFILDFLNKKSKGREKIFQIFLCFLSVSVFVTVFLLQFTRGDSSLADVYPKEVNEIAEFFMYK